jgi:hypothetical protein
VGAVGPLRKNAAEVSIGDISQEPGDTWWAREMCWSWSWCNKLFQ